MQLGIFVEGFDLHQLGHYVGLPPVEVNIAPENIPFQKESSLRTAWN